MRGPGGGSCDYSYWRYTERRYSLIMIRSFKNRDTEVGGRSPPGNRLEALSGERVGQHSIRINDQWRICFVWRNGDAYDVEIVNYH